MAKFNSNRAIVGEFDKSSGERVVITCGIFHHVPTIDMRVYLSEDGATYTLPTRKGLSLRPEKVRHLINCLEKALVEAEKLEAPMYR